MKITYDGEVDALYMRFKETTVTTKHLGEGIAADYDAEGRLAGIEILGTRILPKLRSGSDLKVGVEFSVTVTNDSAGGLADQLRHILQELGLAGAVRVE